MADNAQGKRGASGRSQGGGKRTKYNQPSRGGSGQAVPHGSRGILVTCEQNREDRAGREILGLVEEHYEKLLPAAAAPEPAVDESKPVDIAALISAEVAELKDRSKRRLNIHHTGVKGCLYVIFPKEPEYPAPYDVVVSILEEAQSRRQLRAPNCSRLLPITHSCYCKMEDIQILAREVIGATFGLSEAAKKVDEEGKEAAQNVKEEGKEAAEKVQQESSAPVDEPQTKGDEVSKVESTSAVEAGSVAADQIRSAGENGSSAEAGSTGAGTVVGENGGVAETGYQFAVEYEHRSADQFDRMEMINTFVNCIPQPPHKVNLKNPELTVLVELTRNSCAAAVVKRYRELSKFNLRMLADPESESVRHQQSNKRSKG